MSEEIFEKVCWNCKGDPQPLENFHRDKGSRDGHVGICKICACAKASAWAEANPEKVSANVREWQKANPEKVQGYARDWKTRNPDYKKNDEFRKRSNDARATKRREAIEAMGSVCDCCGCDVYEFICFEHIGGWGAIHRKTVHTSSLPGWLKKHGYPKGDGTICEACGEIHQGVRLLCFSCNMSVAADPDGICAHKRTEPVEYGDIGKKARYAREYRAKLREEVLTEYGGRCQCPGCNEANFAFLSIEHVGGWGGDHRKVVYHSANLMWLKKHHFPKGNEICPECGETHGAITVTCFCCNMASAKSNGQCPHVTNQQVAIAA